LDRRFRFPAFFVPERRRSFPVLNLAPIGIGADLCDRLATVRELHQLAGAARRKPDLGFENAFPFRPGGGVGGLQAREVLPSRNVMLFRLILGFVAFFYMGSYVAH